MTSQFSGPDGNAFMIMGIVRRYLIDIGESEGAKVYIVEATSGDYEHLLEVSLEYCPGLEFEGL